MLKALSAVHIVRVCVCVCIVCMYVCEFIGYYRVASRYLPLATRFCCCVAFRVSLTFLDKTYKR